MIKYQKLWKDSNVQRKERSFSPPIDATPEEIAQAIFESSPDKERLQVPSLFLGSELSIKVPESLPLISGLRGTKLKNDRLNWLDWCCVSREFHVDWGNFDLINDVDFCHDRPPLTGSFVSR